MCPEINPKTWTTTLLIVTILVSVHFNPNTILAPVNAQSTWTVDDNGPADYRKIQEAVNAASPGDTIYVRNGTYIENIIINKTITLIGENRDGTIIDGNLTSTIIRINRANNVTVTGFTMQNSGREVHLFETTGVFLYYSSGAQIYNNKMVNNEAGIYFYVAGNNTIKNNLVTDNYFYGILMDYVPGPPKNIITNNVLVDNGFGIGLDSSFGHVISNNIIINSTYDGIYIFSNSHNNTITENTVINATNAIHLKENNRITLEGNTIINNRASGIHLATSSLNNVTGNLIKGNVNGIYLRDNSNNNTFTENQISTNTAGIRFRKSSNNLFFHNNINNTNQLIFEDATPLPNVWDYGYPSGGNYWNDYAGADIYSGQHQNITGSDGIGDTPYTLTADSNLDHYPLMTPKTLPIRFHDITILNVTLSANEVYLGQTVSITITAANRGTFTENFTITSSYNLEGNEYIAATTHVNNLSPQTNTTIKISWQPQHAGTHKIKTYISTPIGDINPSDNTFNQTQVTVKPLDGISPFLYPLAATTIIIALATSLTLYYKKTRKPKRPQK